MKVGLIGLPGAGVTTLFCLLSGRDYAALTGSGKIEINLGEAKVPDERVDKLAEYHNPRKIVYPVIEFADIPVQLEPSGALSASTVSHLRTMDALALVIRAFDNPAVPHPKNSIDPLRDIESFRDEALLTDLIQIEKRLERIQKEGRIKSREGEFFLKLKDHLEKGLPIRTLELTPEQKKEIAGFKFITEKPWIVLLNVDPDERIDTSAAESFAAEAGFPVLKIAGAIELEICDLEPDEQAEFLADLGVEKGAKDRFIRTVYSHLNLISFLTMGPDECRAWSIPKGSDAVTAAGKIHTDLARGFIRAEVIHFDDYIAADGSMPAAKKAGKVRLEGKNYIVQDGDILNIRFSV